MSPRQTSSVDWTNLVFLAAVHLVGVVGSALYLVLARPSIALLALAAVSTVVTIFAISAGYHRLFSHRAYEAHPLVRLFFLIFGASAFQTSALTWSANHRRHHARTDTPDDPYSVRRGFWHAHVGWVLEMTPSPLDATPARDLQADPLVRWQHRHFVLIAALAAFGLPLLAGVALGDVWGGLLLVGFGRLVFVYQVTFAVNSLAHRLGSQPYSNRESSRDSFWCALVTMGEGYHNYHHTFPGDYRNGVRSYHFDPTKWIVYSLSKVGLARNLRRTPAKAIERARARMRAQHQPAAPQRSLLAELTADAQMAPSSSTS
ncbi:MAG: fatty acid desaturase [Myxococcales bacterium]|nr:fatty acid desaturase [Myxococcales bacterium]